MRKAETTAAIAATTSDNKYFESFLSTQCRAKFVPRPAPISRPVGSQTPAAKRKANAETAIRVAVKYPEDKKIQERADEIVAIAAWHPVDVCRATREGLQAVVGQMCDDANFRTANPHLTNGDILRIRALRWPREYPPVRVYASNGIDKVVRYPRSKLACHILIIRVVANMDHLQSTLTDFISISITSPFTASATTLTLSSLALTLGLRPILLTTTTRKWLHITVANLITDSNRQKREPLGRA